MILEFPDLDGFVRFVCLFDLRFRHRDSIVSQVVWFEPLDSLGNPKQQALIAAGQQISLKWSVTMVRAL